MQMIKPLSLSQAVWMFGIPGILLGVMHYGVYPFLKNIGIASNLAYLIFEFVFMGGLIIAAYIGIAREGNAASRATILERWRIQRMTGQDWNWMTVGLVLFFVLTIATQMLFDPFIDRLIAWVGWTSPRVGYDLDRTSWFSMGILGICTLLNIVGEELWWRGYILPRQELQHGESTWIVHGVLWALFHIYRPWDIPSMLVVAPVVPFIVQHRKNTSISLVMHLLLNTTNYIFGMM